MAVLVIVTMSFNACTKTIEKQVNQAVSGKANGARLEGNTYGKDVSKEDLEDVMNLENPMRDVLRYLKNGGRLPETKHFKDFLSYFKTGKKEGIIGNGSYPWGCSSTPSSSTGLVVLGYPGAPPCGGSTNQRIGNTTFANASSALDCPTYIQDAFGNKIYVLGMYGTADERQGYYVYLPDNYNANSKIVVLIHGGAWMEGPDLDKVNGWGSAYSTTPAQNNIVKNLLNQGFVVVAPTYRLVQYGDNPTDFTTNPISVFDQVDDIDAAIQHIHSNFPTCLGINANNIQVMGESAGGHLALMFAYTKANTSYIKSVISVSAPTNINQYADFINNKSLIYNQWSSTVSCNTSVGNNFVLDNFNYTNKTHFPFFSLYDPFPTPPVLTKKTYLNPQNYLCKINNLYFGTYLNLGSIQNTTTPPLLPITINSPASNNLNLRRLDLYNLAQSIVRQQISIPLTSTIFSNISPCFQLNASKNIPTFILHGTFDELVIYSQSTNTMDTRLAANGGVGIYNSSNQNINGLNSPAPILSSIIPMNYTSGNKHIIKTYTNSGHVFYNPISSNPQVQPDILTWLNGH